MIITDSFDLHVWAYLKKSHLFSFNVFFPPSFYVLSKVECEVAALTDGTFLHRQAAKEILNCCSRLWVIGLCMFVFTIKYIQWH